MIKHLQFRDLYLGCTSARVSRASSESQVCTLDEDEYANDLSKLREMCNVGEASALDHEFQLTYQDLVFRVSVLLSVSDKIYVLRRMPEKIRTLEEISLHRYRAAQLMQPRLTGLVVVAGAYGQGKTTTAGSFISARLKQFGGVAVTVEDPPELPLDGMHGAGVCYQTAVDSRGFAHACRRAARWSPSILFLSEIRDSLSAAEALRASINGCLVFLTVHADSIPMAVERLNSYASAAFSGANEASSMLASGLRCVVHQQLVADGSRVKMDWLWIDDGENRPARSIIRDRRFEQIPSEIDRQLNKLLN